MPQSEQTRRLEKTTRHNGAWRALPRIEGLKLSRRIDEIEPNSDPGWLEPDDVQRVDKLQAAFDSLSAEVKALKENRYHLGLVGVDPDSPAAKQEPGKVAHYPPQPSAPSLVDELQYRADTWWIRGPGSFPGDGKQLATLLARFARSEIIRELKEAAGVGRGVAMTPQQIMDRIKQWEEQA